jgi:acyl-CoA reductase-like NAD-dependent aldehyde dehydrogenase
MKTITNHYIDGAFVESHGREAMDSINPSNGELIARALLADEEDTRRAIAAAKRASWAANHPRSCLRMPTSIKRFPRHSLWHS